MLRKCLLSGLSIACFSSFLVAQPGPFRSGTVGAPITYQRLDERFNIYSVGEDFLFQWDVRATFPRLFRFSDNSVEEVFTDLPLSRVSKIGPVANGLLIQVRLRERGNDHELHVLSADDWSFPVVVELPQSRVNSYFELEGRIILSLHNVTTDESTLARYNDTDNTLDTLLSIPNSYLPYMDWKQVGRLIFFSDLSGLYVTDGTQENSHVLIAEARVDLFENNIVFFNDEWYFNFNETLYLTDGTPEGTRPAVDPTIRPELVTTALGQYVAGPDGVLYIGRTAAHGAELFLTDGTSTGSRLVREFAPGAVDGILLKHFVEGGVQDLPGRVMAFVAADSSGKLTELWQSDGTTAGTTFMTALPGVATKIYVIAKKIFGEGKYHVQRIEVYFDEGVEEKDYTLGAQLDSSPVRSVLIDASRNNDISLTPRFLTVGDWLIYRRNLREPENTWGGQACRGLDQEVIELPSSLYLDFTEHEIRGDRIFHSIYSSENGSEPGVYTMGDTTHRLLLETHPGRRGSRSYYFSNEESTYFIAHNPSSGYGVYRTDGTSEGTRFLADLHQLDSLQYLGEYRSLAGKLLAPTTEAWTVADPLIDTLLVYPGPVPPNYQPSAALGDYVAFDDAGTDRRLVSPRDSVSLANLFAPETLTAPAVTYQNEFVYLAANANQSPFWWLTFVDPATGEVRRDTLGVASSSGVVPRKEYLFVAGGTLYVVAPSSGFWPLEIYRYVGPGNLLPVGVPLGSNLDDYLPGLAGSTGLVMVDDSVSTNHLVLGPTDTEFVRLSSGSERFDDPTGIVRLSEKTVVLTRKRLLVLDNAGEPSRPQEELLTAADDFLLGKLTYLGGDFAHFARYGTESVEIWRTDGTTTGTELLRNFTVRPYLQDSRRPFPTVGSFIGFVGKNETGFVNILYDLVGDNVFTEERLDGDTWLAADASGKFYFTNGIEGTSKELQYYALEAAPARAGFVTQSLRSDGTPLAEEPGVPGQTIQVRHTGRSYRVFSDEEGRFEYFAPVADTAILTLEPSRCWEPVGATTITITTPDSLPKFTLRPVSGAEEINLSLVTSPLRCGFTVPTWLKVTNTGCQPLTDMEVFLELDEDVRLDSSRIEPTGNTEQRLSWVLPRLAMGASWENSLTLTMPDESRTGQPVPFLLTVSSDEVTDTLFTAPTLRCAIDPNDKLVQPARTENNYTQIDETLTYTIRFQNTGNDTAFNVRLEDQLSPDLDLKTFRPLAASHPHRVELADDGLLQVFFDNILLPDSNVNYQASNGFFSFTIALDGTALDQKVPNTAGIYFDFNAPVITNTVTSSVVEFLDEDTDGFFFWRDCNDRDSTINPNAFDTGGNGIDENCDGNDWTTAVRNPLPGNLQLFPNPTSGWLELRYSLPDRLLVEIFDGRGRRMQSKELRSQGRLNLGGMPAAVYQIKLTDPRTGRFVGRRVVVR